MAAAPASSSSGGVISTELLDELLLQVAGQLSSGAVSSSRVCRQVLPALAAAFVPGGCWASAPGGTYTPSPVFCGALWEALLELRGYLQARGGTSLGSGDGEEGSGELPGLLWLGLLVQFGDLAAGGFRPSDVWLQAASEDVFCQCWGGVLEAVSAPAGAAPAPAAAQVWQAVPGEQFAAWLGAVGRLQHEPCYLPGWPDQVLSRLQGLLGELSGHELGVALLGLAHQQQRAEMAAAGLLPQAAVAGSSGSSMLAALATVKPQLLAAAEAASLAQLSGGGGYPQLDAGDLATLAHALQQLGHTPSPSWVSTWSAAIACQLPGCSPAAAVLQIVALAGFSARPSAELLQGLVDRCQAGLGQLELPQLLGFARALLLLGYRPEARVLQDVVKAGQAAAARAAKMGGPGSSTLQAEMLSELQQLVVQLAG